VADTTSVADANVVETVQVVRADPEITVHLATIFDLDVGGSAALTVGQGNVNWSNALMGTSTDSSTTIVRGGMLTLTDNIMTGNFQGSQPLMEVDGGTVILGKADGTDSNALVTYGSAPFVNVQGNGMVIVEPGNIFDQMTSNLTAQRAGTTSVQLISSA